MSARESHDGAYKLLFSHPLMVRELLEGFVREDWGRRLDFATLERVNGHYVDDRLRQRPDDIVWRARMADGGGWLYLYLLLEFQSRSDRWMALRLMNYVGLLWQDLVRSKRLAAGNRLPPVFPLVIYNGSHAGARRRCCSRCWQRRSAAPWPAISRSSATSCSMKVGCRWSRRGGPAMRWPRCWC